MLRQMQDTLRSFRRSRYLLSREGATAMRNDLDTIRELVAKLATNHQEQHPMFFEPNKERRTAGQTPGWGILRVQREPLLTELRSAIVSSIGNAGASSTFGSRLPFDAQARALYEQIETGITALYAEHVAAPYPSSPESALQAWLVAFAYLQPVGTDREWFGPVRGRLHRWVWQIEHFFDPPISREITTPCPRCGARYAVDEETGFQISALVLRYRVEPMSGIAQAESVECRAEKYVWRGPDGVDAFTALVEVHDE